MRRWVGRGHLHGSGRRQSVFSCTVAYGFAGLMTGVFKGQSKTACAVAYVLSNAVTVLWAWDGGLRLSSSMRSFSASVLFPAAAGPAAAEGRRPPLPGAGDDTGDRAAAYVRERLRETAGAFRELYETMKGAFRRPGPNDGDMSAILTGRRARLCRRCPAGRLLAAGLHHHLQCPQRRPARHDGPGPRGAGGLPQHFPPGASTSPPS